MKLFSGLIVMLSGLGFSADLRAQGVVFSTSDIQYQCYIYYPTSPARKFPNPPVLNFSASYPAGKALNQFDAAFTKIVRVSLDADIGQKTEMFFVIGGYNMYDADKGTSAHFLQISAHAGDLKNAPALEDAVAPLEDARQFASTTAFLGGTEIDLGSVQNFDGRLTFSFAHAVHREVILHVDCDVTSLFVERVPVSRTE